MPRWQAGPVGSTHHQDRIAVAVRLERHDAQPVAARLPLAPAAAARTAEEGRLAARLRLRERGLVHIGEHQHLQRGRVLHHARDKSLGPVERHAQNAALARSIAKALALPQLAEVHVRAVGEHDQDAARLRRDEVAHLDARDVAAPLDQLHRPRTPAQLGGEGPLAERFVAELGIALPQASRARRARAACREQRAIEREQIARPPDQRAGRAEGGQPNARRGLGRIEVADLRGRKAERVRGQASAADAAGPQSAARATARSRVRAPRRARDSRNYCR